MVKKGIVPQLISLLERMNYEFLTLVLTFLKKLSIFNENMAVVGPNSCSCRNVLVTAGLPPVYL